MRKRIKNDFLVPYTITQVSELANCCEKIIVNEPFLPPKIFDAFIDLEVTASVAVIVFLGSVEEKFRHERIDLPANHILSAAMDPFNWICIQKASKEPCAISYSKRTLTSLNKVLPALSNELKEKFAEDSTITLTDVSLTHFANNNNLGDWKESISAMVNWYQTSSADTRPWYHPQFIIWLEDLTNLKLSYPKERPIWRRFEPGHYVIMNDKYPQEPGLDLIYTLETTCASAELSNWIYLDEYGEELLRIPCDKPNSLTLVYKTAGEDGEASIKRFKQYWPHTQNEKNAYVIQMIITFLVMEEK